MVPIKRDALIRRHEASRVPARSIWPRHANGRAAQFRPAGNHDMLRGLAVGVPLGLALWLALAFIAWWIV